MQSIACMDLKKQSTNHKVHKAVSVACCLLCSDKVTGDWDMYSSNVCTSPVLKLLLSSQPQMQCLVKSWELPYCVFFVLGCHICAVISILQPNMDCLPSWGVSYGFGEENGPSSRLRSRLSSQSSSHQPAPIADVWQSNNVYKHNLSALAFLR
jgi:hypothetical protein